ncbi:MAG: CDP-alcohol phosphatidyltransferase family protein, partial [Nanoarchaeota archaeon]|nr:CDP-alcohol phosphatidyltransferase family protein [Nanoarchaeota archaeon]
MTAVTWKRPKYKGSFYQNFFRKVATPITKVLHNTKVTPNQVTGLAILLTILPGYLFYKDNIYLNLTGIAVLYIIHILDKVDGQLARSKNMTSMKGIFLDGILHNMTIISIYISFSLKFFENGLLLASFLSVISLIIIFVGRYNYLNRTYLVGSEKSNEINKLKINKKIPRLEILKRIYSLPKQNFPEILIIAIVLRLTDIFFILNSIYLFL